MGIVVTSTHISYRLVSRRGNSLGVNLPAAALRVMGLQKGDWVRVRVFEGQFVVDKAETLFDAETGVSDGGDRSDSRSA